MAIARQSPPRRMSEKRLKALGGKAFSTIVKKPSSRPRPKAKQRERNDPKRIYGGEYADWIRSLPCEGCGYQGPAVEAAHTENGGMGRKADAKTLVPLCGPRLVPVEGRYQTPFEGCHRFAHRVGHRKLEKVYKVDLKAKAAELWATWQQMRGEA